jgi:Outer membrane protein beta-barrel domain
MIHQGVWLGTLSGSISSTNSTTSSSISIEPGYMVTDNIGVGIKFAYMSSGSFNNNTIFGSVRYYFDPANKQWVPFIGPFIGYSKSNQGGNAATIYGGNAGIEFFIAPNVSFTPSINYFRTTASGVNTNTWSFAFGFTFWYAPSK